TGTGEPGATVTITNAAGTTIGTATVAPGGTYTATLATPQLNGETLTALQTDPAGNHSPSVTAIAPDTTPPAAPAATVD
ncbi:Ig-like domain-containing protein, partial [Escherichia coli]|uniref:Ig-like domain-containing protein n=23 Tax=Bacteria TaxID=2 RepID=UPI001933D043